MLSKELRSASEASQRLSATTRILPGGIESKAFFFRFQIRRERFCLLSRAELGTSTAGLDELSTALIIVAPSGERVHVVEGPYDRSVFGNLRKKVRIIDKSGDPMKVDYITWRNLTPNLGSQHASVITENFLSLGPILSVDREIRLDTSAANAAHSSRENVRSTIKCDYSLLVFLFGEVSYKKDGIVTEPAKAIVEPSCRSAGAAIQLSAEVDDPHVFVASIYTEPGLYAVPSGSLSSPYSNQFPIWLSEAVHRTGLLNPASSSNLPSE